MLINILLCEDDEGGITLAVDPGLLCFQKSLELAGCTLSAFGLHYEGS
jgi:hypothetical protein